MAAKLYKGDQLTNTYVNASGEVTPGQVINSATGIDHVVVNLANDTVGQNTAVALPDGSAIYVVDKDTDFACTEGVVYAYNTTDAELSGATAAGSVGCWLAVEDVLAAATTVKCQHVIVSVPA